MTAQLIDGNALCQEAPRRSRRARRGPHGARHHAGPGRHPGRRGPGRAGLRAQQGQGLRRHRPALGARAATRRRLTEAELLARIDALNDDPAIHGILVQLPLPTHIDAHKVIETISPRQGRRRLPRRQRRRADGRPARLLALHALRLHEDAREHRLRSARQACGGHRPQQHRRQADGADAACKPTPPSPSATARRRIWRTTRGRPTWSSPRSAGASC